MALAALKQLDAEALGQVRKTAEDPPRVSVLDLISVITGLGTNNARNYWIRFQAAHPEVATESSNFKFPGRGQRETPVIGARGAVEIVMLLPGKAADSFRKGTADVIVRFLGGDPRIVDEIAATRILQQQLPGTHPMRIFGETVEAEARHHEPEDEHEEPARKRAKPEEMWLYVFSYSFDPWGLQFGYKIGRSSDVEARRLDLGSSHAFTIIEHARFRCSGHLECALHRRFAEHRVESGAGCEWYFVSLADILHAIAELQVR